MNGPGPDATKSGETGMWSMVYDQSIQIELPQRNGKYTANFRYSLKDSTSQRSWDELKTSSYEKFESRCDDRARAQESRLPSMP